MEPARNAGRLLYRPPFDGTSGDIGACDARNRSGNLPTYRIDVPGEIETIEAVNHDGWDEDAESTRQQGTDFLSANRYALMKIPSVIMPKASNYLLNPNHDDAPHITIAGVYRYPFDSRLIK